MFPFVCAVPIEQTTGIAVLYVLVTIALEPAVLDQFELAVGMHIPVESLQERNLRLALMGTVQFLPDVQLAAARLRARGYSVLVPHVRPLSPGEVLGCTAPRLPDDVGCFVCVRVRVLSAACLRHQIL